MTMPEFKSLEQLWAYAQAVNDNILRNEVATFAKDNVKASVHNIVYAKYSPRKYKRRGQPINNALGTGSLADTDVMHHTVKDGVLEITDDADFKTGYGGVDTSKSLAENIEFGYGDYPWSEPRPFMEDAQDYINRSGEVEHLIKEGFEKKFGKGSIV